MEQVQRRHIKTIFTNEKVIASIICLNSVAIFLQGFPSLEKPYGSLLSLIDILCVFFFILECSLKISQEKKEYFKSGWNNFDFLVTVASLPSLILLVLPSEDLGWLGSLSVLRAGRLLRFLRLLKFIPNSDHLAKGILRATKASVGIFIALGLINITLSMVATMAFGQLSPENFGNPLRSSYTLLKMFTVEGWYEIPDQVVQESDPTNTIAATSLRLYAIFTVLIGGILGMGLANAVFIDEMTADNTDKLERSLEELNNKLEVLTSKIDKQMARDIMRKPPA
jgi:voltage-gated sodium channel